MTSQIILQGQKIPSQLRWTFLGIALTIAENGGKCREEQIKDFEHYNSLRGVFTVTGDEWSADFIERKKSSKFVPPTHAEVSAEIGDMASDFIDFYASKGWVVGKAKMKDWKAAARRWKRSNEKESQIKTKQDNDKLGARSTKSEFATLVNKVTARNTAG